MRSVMGAFEEIESYLCIETDELTEMIGQQKIKHREDENNRKSSCFYFEETKLSYTDKKGR